MVYPKPGEALLAGELIGFAATKIAGFKVPARIWFTTEALPRLGSAKIDKVTLRNIYRERHRAGV